MRKTVIQRLADRATVTAAGCFVWTGAIRPDGYGAITVDGKTRLVHRAALAELSIDVPSGYVVDHLCRNRACFNPDHLEPVTRSENTRRGNSPWAVNARKTHCHRGHEFTPENTGSQLSGRFCIACRRALDAIRHGSPLAEAARIELDARHLRVPAPTRRASWEGMR
jgi:hypothetical protein